MIDRAILELRLANLLLPDHKGRYKRQCMLPNQIFNHVGSMERIIHEISLLDRLFDHKAAQAPVTSDLPDYLNNPNLAEFKKLFPGSINEPDKTGDR